MRGLAAEQLEGVAERRENGRQRLGRPLLAAGQVDDQGLPAHPGQPARKHGCRGACLAGPAHLLPDPRHLAAHVQRCRRRRPVARSATGSARGHDQVRPRLSQEGPDLIRFVGDQVAAGDLDPGLFQQPRDGGTTPILELAGRAAIADGYDPGGWRFQTPLLPPLFSSSRTDSSQTPGSKPFTMSMIVSPATVAAVRASISTPVRALTRAVATISTPSGRISKSTLTDELGSG